MNRPHKQYPGIHIGLLSTALLLTTQLVAQNWAPSAAGNNGPSARSLSASAYDLGRKVTVLFGGREANGAASAETWEWNHLGWFRRSSTGPTPRLAHSLAYDSSRLRTVLFGGFDAAGSPIGDTWEWDGNNWALIQTPNAPAPRGAASVAYDSIRGRTVLFGGKSLGGALMNDTWEWDGFSWAQVSAAQAPSARQHAAMAFDNARGVCVLTCGEDSLQARSDTWTYDGSDWTALNLGFEPGPRAAAQLVRDELSGDMLLVGGRSEDGANLYPDDWLWNGVAWTIPGSALPAPTHSVACSFDIHRGKFVLFGGQGTSGPVGETLVRSSSASRTISTLTPPRIGAPAVYHYAHPTSAAGNIQWMLLSPRFDSEFYLQVPGFVTVGDVRIDLSSILLDIPGILDNSGSKTVSIAIPDDASLLGFGFDLQSVEVDLRNERIYWSDNEASSTIAIGLQNLYQQVSNGQAQTFNTNEGAVVNIPAGAVPAGIPVQVGIATQVESRMSDSDRTASGLQVSMALPLDDITDDTEIEIDLPAIGFTPAPLDPNDPSVLNATVYMEVAPGVGIDLPVTISSGSNGTDLLRAVVRISRRVIRTAVAAVALTARTVVTVAVGVTNVALTVINFVVRVTCNLITLPPPPEPRLLLSQFDVFNNEVLSLVNGPEPQVERACIIVHGMGQNGASMPTLRREVYNARIQVNGATQRLYDRVYTLDYPFEGGVRHSAERFRYYARNIRANEIDIIAHSLGGLVSRWAMEMNTAPAWSSSSGQISKFLTLGTPHDGVPQALASQFPIVNGVLQCTNQHLVDLSYGSRVVEDLRNSNPAYRGTFYYALAGNKPCCLTGNLLQSISNAFYILQSHDGIVSVNSASSSTLASKGIYMGPGPQAAQYYNHYEMFEDALYVRREIISRMKEGRDGVTRPTMVEIAPGSFSMGSNNGVYVEQPVHTVTISRSFWISRYEITQAEYRSLMGNNPSVFQSSGSDTKPVENVSWNNAVAFCTQLNNQERSQGRLRDGYEYRLPTEAEWEYCCRAGTQTEWHTGTSLACGQATFAGPTCSATATNRVGQHMPNAWGLYDMHGNVAEYCMDAWDVTPNYPAGAVTDPRSTTGVNRIFRGGAWNYTAFNCRSALRGSNLPDRANSLIGFRVVLAPILAP